MELKTLYAIIAGVVILMAGIVIGRVGFHNAADTGRQAAISCGCNMPGCSCGANCGCGAGCKASGARTPDGCGCAGMNNGQPAKGGCDGKCGAMRGRHPMEHVGMNAPAMPEGPAVIEMQVQPLPMPN